MAWIEDEAQKLSNNKQFQILEPSKTISQCKAVRAEAEDFASSTNSWKTEFNFGDARDKFNSVLEKLDDALDDAQNLQECIKELQGDEDEAVVSKKRAWRAQRDKLTAWFVLCGVPRSIAKAYANCLYNHAVPCSSVGLKCPFPPVEYSIEQGVTLADVTKGPSTLTGGANSAATDLHKACAEFMADL